MAKKKESKIIWIIVLLLFIFYFKPDFFGALVTPTTETFTNFIGDLSTYQGAKPSVISNTIQIEDYMVKISQKDYGTIYGEPTCLPNTCNGNLLRTEQGCDVWGKKECKSWYPNCDSFLVALSCHHWWCPACDCRGFGTPREYTGTDCNRFFNKDFDIMDGCIESQTGYSFTDAWSNIQTFIVPTTECGGYGSGIVYTNDPNVLDPTTSYTLSCELNGNCECWYKYDVYKNNELIKQADWDSNKYTGRKKANIGDEFEINFLSDYIIDNSYSSSTSRYGEGCLWIKNIVNFLVPTDKIDFTISLNQETSELTIKVTNNWKELTGNLVINYEIPTAIGRVEDTKENIVDIPLGEKTFTYSIPATELIYVTPKLDILYSGNQVSGLNGKCYKGTEIKNLNTCDFVLVAEITEETHTVSEAEFLRGKITSLETEISELNRILIEREQIRNDLLNKITEMNLELNTLETSLLEQENTITELEEKIALKQQDITNLQLLLINAENQINEITNLIIEKQLKIQELQEENLKQEKRIADLLINLEEKINKLAEVEALTEEQLVELERIRILFAEEQVKIAELTNLVENGKLIINEINNSNNNQITLSAELKEQNDLLKDKVNELELNVELEKQTAESFRLHLEETKALVLLLQSQNKADSETMERIKALNKELQDLTNELIDKNRELEKLLEEQELLEPTKIPAYVFYIIIGFIALLILKGFKKT